MILAGRGEIMPMQNGRPYHLSIPLKIFYSIGALGQATVLLVVTTQLLIYWTDIAGISPVIAGSILFVVKVGDAFTDVIVGMLSDRTRSRWGRRRPWMLAGGICLSLAFLALFNVDLMPWPIILSCTVSVAFFFFGLSMAQVPHLAMFTDITEDYHERTSLSAYVYAVGLFGSSVGLALVPALIGAFGGGRTGYHVMAATISLVPVLAALVAVYGTARAPSFGAIRSAPAANGVRALRIISNKPLLSLLIAKVATYFGAASVFSGMAFFTLHVLKSGALGMVLFGIGIPAGNLVGMLVTARLFGHAQKHLVYGFGLAALGLATLGFSVYNSAVSPAFFAVHTFLFAFLGAMVAIPAQSMIPDVVEWDFLTSGIRREGLISSIISAVQKTSPALGVILIGALLSWGGYLGKNSSGRQPGSAILAIKLGTSVIPGLALCLGCNSTPVFL